MSITVYEVALVPVIMGLAEVMKMMGLPKKYIPLFNLGLGIAGGFYYIAPGNIAEAILVGIAMGLSASGLYSSAKNVIQGVKKGA